MLSIAQAFRSVLVPFIVVGTAALLTLFTVLIAQRLFRAGAQARRAALSSRYRSIVEVALNSNSPMAVDAAAVIPGRHRRVAADLVLSALRVVRGERTARAAVLAERLGLSSRWRADLRSRRWWQRSEAALALGLLHDRESVPHLTTLLDDEHEQVRAAAIDALGQIGDPAVIPALLARMSDPTRHERARVVQALRSFGNTATTALVGHGVAHPEDRGLVATMLSYVGGGAAAADPLLEWTRSDDPGARAAAWRALGKVGIQERAFYHALKALTDDAPLVRAAAAHALALSGRADAAGPLAARLDDNEWEVAAQSARALSRLGVDGLKALRQRTLAGPGLGHDLARQVLWEAGER